jgi:hypothetical protein
MYKIRSSRCPLDRTDEERLIIGSIACESKEFLGIWFFGRSSEKGNTRKHTVNRVTRWAKMFRGNLMGLCWIAKEICLGEFKFGNFWGFTRGSTWSHWGGGAIGVVLGEFGLGGSELPWHAYGWAWVRMSEEFLRTAGAGEGFEWEM